MSISLGEVANDRARPDGPGSHPSDQARSGLGGSRFDPSRIGDAFGNLADKLVDRAWGRE